jgi:hypothetical protein
MGEHLTVTDVPVIIAMVTAITEVIKKYAIPPDYAPLVAGAITILVVMAWAITFEPVFSRALIWPYLTTVVSAWTGAMGTHSVITHVTSKMANQDGGT